MLGRCSFYPLLLYLAPCSIQLLVLVWYIHSIVSGSNFLFHWKMVVSSYCASNLLLPQSLGALPKHSIKPAFQGNLQYQVSLVLIIGSDFECLPKASSLHRHHPVYIDLDSTAIRPVLI